MHSVSVLQCSRLAPHQTLCDLQYNRLKLHMVSLYSRPTSHNTPRTSHCARLFRSPLHHFDSVSHCDCECDALQTKSVVCLALAASSRVAVYLLVLYSFFAVSPVFFRELCKSRHIRFVSQCGRQHHTPFALFQSAVWEQCNAFHFCFWTGRRFTLFILISSSNV